MTAGTYGGGTIGWPWGGGFGLYFDNRGRVYPQLYGGTPKLSLSAGYTPDLEGLLTGPSFSGSAGIGSVRFNAAGSGGASGFGVGTPGIGATHGYGPYELSDDFSRPWAKPYIRDSVASAIAQNQSYGNESQSRGAWKSVPLPGLTPPPRSPAWNDSFVRDSAAAAGIPSRNNVFEYGFPEPGSVQPPLTAPGATRGAGYVGAAVAPPVPFISTVPQNMPGGLPGLIIEAGLNDPLNPDAPTPGGLLGLLQESLRGNFQGRN